MHNETDKPSSQKPYGHPDLENFRRRETLFVRVRV